MFSQRNKIYFIWYSALFAVAVLFNFLWEVGHAGLYEWLPPMERTIGHLFWFSVKDAVLYLIFFFLVAISARSFLWFKQLHLRHIALLVFIGFITSFVIEYIAIETGRWAYNASMPIIPFLNVGLTPLLQMSFGPVIVIGLLLLTIRCAPTK